MVNGTPYGPPRRRARLTRRGRLFLLLAAVLAVAAAVLITLLVRTDDEVEQPGSLLIPEGWRAAQVYAAVDKTLGTTAARAHAARAAAPASG